MLARSATLAAVWPAGQLWWFWPSPAPAGQDTPVLNVLPGALLMPAGQACCQLGSLLLSSGSQISLQVCSGAYVYLQHLHSCQIRPKAADG